MPTRPSPCTCQTWLAQLGAQLWLIKRAMLPYTVASITSSELCGCECIARTACAATPETHDVGVAQAVGGVARGPSGAFSPGDDLATVLHDELASVHWPVCNDPPALALPHIAQAAGDAGVAAALLQALVGAGGAGGASTRVTLVVRGAVETALPAPIDRRAGAHLGVLFSACSGPSRHQQLDETERLVAILLTCPPSCWHPDQSLEVYMIYLCVY